MEQLFQADPVTLDRTKALAVFGEFKRLLNAGSVRAAEHNGRHWIVNHWVKKGILLG
ncbi:MAG: 2,3,4,5-tetrahydropyridine-2,6-dicarboxylate N-succinyltransferase, partial [Ignavibacteria bacterium]|nr:2,3,4,5-tetrahydropyridine-2,6-dicarboxylate N-succinyltransferase [Ignavibacteria bacterium]